jgi:hypothetical protein
MSSNVESDRGANRGTLVYLIVLGLAGVGLIVLARKLELGEWAYFVGGLLALTGIVGPIGMLMGGGHGIAKCPACGTPHTFLGEGQEQTMACAQCGAWMMTKNGVVSAVPDDYVSSHPVFTTPLAANGVVWPAGCPACGEHATREVEVKGYNRADLVRNVLVPVVKVQRSLTIAAPACAQHDDGVALVVHASDHQELGFRSIRYLRAFRAANARA